MVDFNRILSGLTQGGVATGLSGAVLAGAAGSKKGPKTATTLLKTGGAAAVGALAWNAYQGYQSASTPPDEAIRCGWGSVPEASFDVTKVDSLHAGSNSLLIVRAMITAAMSDGHLDSSEQIRIFEDADKLALGRDDKAALFDELRNPQNVREIVAAVRSPAVAIEVYAVSLLAIDEMTFEGKAYLSRLASMLNMPAELVDAIHLEVDAEIATHEAA